MRTFQLLVANTLAANVTNNFLWFALTFWIYLETRSVVATAIVGGGYMLLAALSAMAFGTFVDRHLRATSMMLSSLVTLSAFGAAAALYVVAPPEAVRDIGSPAFWALTALVLGGAIAGNLRTVALSTTVTLLVPEDRRDRANGLVGTANGLAFAITSVFSGLAVGFLGMGGSLAIGFFVYLVLVPVAEASEQTVIQSVVPFKEQGRVFGFAQTLEAAASPITAFLIGPIAQFAIIPSMTDGALADTIGTWFGTGAARGMALVFIVAGVVGLVVTLLALMSGPYRRLSARYFEAQADADRGDSGQAASAA